MIYLQKDITSKMARHSSQKLTLTSNSLRRCAVFIEKCPIKIDLEAKKNKTAIILDEQTISYGQLNAKIDEAVIYLQGAGVQRGHRVALIARNNLQTVIAFFALARLGAACCALSTRLPHDALPTKIKELAADFFLDTLTSIVSVTGSSNTDITKGLVFSIMYTSGSSSAPKMAAHSIDNFLYSALGSNEAL
ncbi:MAG: long-chain fatty acid--CoA ligase, partial [Chlamydiae bacterium]|nr:long-chain fatty acid--CoA ligase [Chlamydiota bacterium]